MQTILLIKNSSDILSNMTGFLEMEGYKILTANSAKKGIEYAKEYMPDLIICDVSIPELGGYGVLNALKESSMASIIPFVLTASASEKMDIMEAYKLGVDDYLLKPFSTDALLKMVRTQIRRARNLTLHI